MAFNRKINSITTSEYNIQMDIKNMIFLSDRKNIEYFLQKLWDIILNLPNN